METLAGRFQRSLTDLNRCFTSEMVRQLNAQVTGTQVFMLHYIKESGSCRLTTLAEKLDVKPSAVTVMIDRLAKSGYVIRESDATDRRVIIARLTDEGENVIAQARERRKQIIAQYMERLSAEEKQTVTVILEKLAEAAQKLSAGTH